MWIRERAQIESLSYCCLAACLVVVFIQTINVWRWLDETLGGTGAMLVPFVLAVCLLTFLFVARLGNKERLQIYWLYLIVAVVLAGIALSLPDPNFPAKRIHVAEFMLIAFILRRGFCRWSSGMSLIIFTATAGIVLGAHDELIQGLHPDRYFGHRDIVVDGLSAIAGALAGHGLRLYDNVPKRDEIWIAPHWRYLALVVVGLIVFLYPLPGLREVPLPWWTLTPLVVTAFLWYFLDKARRVVGDPASVIVWMVVSAALYPIVTRMTPVVFQ